MKWHLVVERGCRKGVVVRINTEEYRIGRGASCQLRPASATVGWVHCILRQWNDRLFVESGSASTHTVVNGQQINSVRELRVGDRLEIGPLTFVVDALIDARVETKPSCSRQEEAFGNLLLSLDEDSPKSSSLGETSNHTALSSHDTATDHPPTGTQPGSREYKGAVADTTTAAREILHEYLRRPR